MTGTSPRKAASLFLLTALLAGTSSGVAPPSTVGAAEQAPPVRKAVGKPSLKVPAEVSGEVGDFITIVADTEGKKVIFYPLDKGLSVFPAALLTNPKASVVSARTPGRYRVLAITAVGDELSDPALCTVVIGGVPPGPGPGPVPPPTPPDPPPPTPPPTPPTPKVKNLRVLIVFDSAKKNELSQGHKDIIYSTPVRTWLDTKTIQDVDGKTHAWRIWASTVDASAVPHWKKLLDRPRTSLPWLVVEGDGNPVYEAALPASVDEFKAVIEKLVTQGMNARRGGR